MRKPFAYAKNKGTERLISAFIFATHMVQSLYSKIRNFKPLAIFCVCTTRFVSDGPSPKPRRFCRFTAQMYFILTTVSLSRVTIVSTNVPLPLLLSILPMYGT